MIEDEHVWQLIASNMPPIVDRGTLSMREYWEANFLHKHWRASRGDNLMVDFESSRIPNLMKDDEQSSQMYYTFPRVGLQFKTKFTLYSINMCNNLSRIAFKKGSHLDTLPCTETAEYLVTGIAKDTIVKLDFSVDSEGYTNVVVWTVSAIELFVIPPDSSKGLSVTERERRDALNPLTRTKILSRQGELGPDRKILLIHINDEGNIGILSTKTSTGCGMLHTFNFKTGLLVDETVVPSPIQSDPSVATGEWKSRERCDFKGSNEVAALIDDSGVVQAYHHEAKQWCPCHAKYFNPDNQSGPRPKLLRVSGSYVLFWNNSGSSGNDPQGDSQLQLPYYVEVHQITYNKNDLGGSLSSKRVLCECYSSISSAYVDGHRCYISAVLPSNDMFIDVWDHSGNFVSRIHSVNNRWSPQKKYSRIYISKVFWTYNGGLMYVELASDSQNIKMAFRQVLCVPKEEYWQVCSDLKNGQQIRKETHQVIAPTRRTGCISDMYPGKLSPDFKSNGIQVTSWTGT
eukprot:TRINITY_DN3028_c0_g1_i2.p1 TRINITY_DN3028_c0_g1~~TRINITY_DN3028_c0_g1_i2.p1  ORF type:complete len:561 (+),score=51.47 TRINITY_DN3028_c0_g1_i2:141-1685(+)